MIFYKYQKFILTQLNNKKSVSGFSLVELLVVVVIIGLLAAIALPTFLNQANKARQAEASSIASTLLRFQAIHYQEDLEYTTDFEELGSGINVTRINNDPERNFTYTMTSANLSDYIVVAAIPEAEALAGIAGKATPNDNFLCSLNQNIAAHRGQAPTQQLVNQLPAATECPPPSEIAN